MTAAIIFFCLGALLDAGRWTLGRWTLDAQGEAAAEALRVLKEVLVGFTAMLGEAHPNTGTVAAWVEHVRKKLGARSRLPWTAQRGSIDGCTRGAGRRDGRGTTARRWPG